MVEATLPKIALLGGTGAIGKEIVRHLKNSEKVAEIALLCRKPLEEWKPEEFKPKLTIIEMSDFEMENLNSIKDQLTGFHAFLCTLGARVKVGKELFTKVDCEYPTNFAKLGRELEVPYYSLLTSYGTNPKSFLMYPRVKGQCELNVKNEKYPYAVVFKPGFLEARDGEKRVIETIMTYVRIGPRIYATDMGLAMAEHALESWNAPKDEVKFENIENNDIVKYAKIKKAAQ